MHDGEEGGEIAGICRDVRRFLDGLAFDLPGLFRPPPRPAAARAGRGNAAARRAAGDLIKSRAAHWAPLLGVEYRRVFIKEQRSRWGSCSSARNLNFNWRLAAAPAELEALLATHPAVADAAVAGVASSTPGEQIPHALVQLREGATASEAELTRFVADHVASYKRLGGVTFVAKVPRSAAGKILRRELPHLLPRRP